MKRYFKQEFSSSAAGLNQCRHSDFAQSCWQKNGSALPLFIFRAVWTTLFIAIMIASFTFTAMRRPGREWIWFLYLTHWGVLLIVATGITGTVLSGLTYFRKAKIRSSGLCWYVKLYWVFFNTATVIAFLITLVYWTILFGNREIVPNIYIDVCIHAVNSFVMLTEIALCGHPSRILHLYQPLLFGLVYAIFTWIYFMAGGTSPNGNPYIYPILNWNKPGLTIGVITAVAVIITILHLMVVAVGCGRQYCAARLMRKNEIKEELTFADVDATRTSEANTEEYLIQRI